MMSDRSYIMLRRCTCLRDGEVVKANHDVLILLSLMIIVRPNVNMFKKKKFLKVTSLIK